MFQTPQLEKDTTYEIRLRPMGDDGNQFQVEVPVHVFCMYLHFISFTVHISVFEA